MSRVLSYVLGVVLTILHILEFVAMPLENGYPAEEQVTGQEVRLSLPKLVIRCSLPLSFVDYWGDPDRRISALRYQCRIYTPRLCSRLV